MLYARLLVLTGVLLAAVGPASGDPAQRESPKPRPVTDVTAAQQTLPPWNASRVGLSTTNQNRKPHP